MLNRMIRIFISSTFRNFETERNRLTVEVFPELERLCEEKGFSFQVIDLRWGVSREDVAENRSAQVCFDEIIRCQAMSPYINFLIMAGNRYGWKPLPNAISAENWRLLTSGLPRDDLFMKLLRDYYAQDRNSLLTTDYLLKRRSDQSKNRSENDESLRIALDHLAQSRLPEAHRNDFNVSATELEIQLGYFADVPEEARNRTFIMLQQTSGSESDPESPEKAMQAQRLAEKLRRSVDISGRFCKYKKGNDDYIQAVTSFMEAVIHEQIDRTPPLNSLEWSEESLATSFKAVDIQYTTLPQHQQAENVIRASAGKCVLLTGTSGSGKSFFLKHLVSKTAASGDIAIAAVFTDVLPQRRNLGDALSFIIDELRRKECFPDGFRERFNSRHPVKWFERQLSHLKPERQVYIIIDTLEEMFSQSAESVLQIPLPPQVTLVVTIPDRAMLRQTIDLEPQPPVEVTFTPLNAAGAVSLLYALLEKKGRCLQPAQMTAVNLALTDDSQGFTPLYVELLSQKASRIHSDDETAPWRAISFRELLHDVLLQQDKDIYKVFRLHALGFLALSTAGLSESELLSLLSLDEDVFLEIKDQTEWHIPKPKSGKPQKRIPTVLWAMLYAEIHPLLMELDSAGIELLQFRHKLIREEMLTILKKEALDRSLLVIMAEYFEQRDWYFADGTSMMGNHRKVIELPPVYERLARWDDLHGCLNDLAFADAAIRCGMPRALLDYYLKYASTTLEYFILDILQRKDLLHRLWPDSFLPAALAELRAVNFPGFDSAMETALLEQAGISHRLSRSSDGFSDVGIFFPQLHEKCVYALNDDGMTAVLRDGILQLIDLDRGIAMETFCVARDEECFLYWEDGMLIVRYEKERRAYAIEDGQLRERWCRECRKWDGLISHELNRIKAAGGMRERDIFCSSCQYGYVSFVQDGRLEQGMLFYQEPKTGSPMELMVRLHGPLCAVVADASILEIVDLSKEVMLYSERFSRITHAEWSPDGSRLLVVLRGNTLFQINISDCRVIGPMRRPSQDYYQSRLNMLKNVIVDAGRTVTSMAGYRSDAYERNSDAANAYPLFCAFSIRKNLLARYYRINSESKLRLFRLDSYAPFSKPMSVGPILEQDALGIPLYFSKDGRGVVFYDEGQPMLLDLQRKQVISAPEPALRREPLSGSIEAKIKAAYLKDIGERSSPIPNVLPLSKRQRGSLLDRFQRSREKPQTAPSSGSDRIEVLCDGKVYWLADMDRGIICAYDDDGRCLGRDMPGKLMATDLRDDKLYLLLESSEQIVCYQI